MLEINVKITIEPVLNADGSQLDPTISFAPDIRDESETLFSLIMKSGQIMADG